ncbi:MAG TPA: hypothetical protein ENI59_02395 [Euryarchaeota archaeon]|nr:hypothetical protein [Euryarchaeota archaeon]
MVELEKEEIPEDVLRALEEAGPYIQRLNKILQIIKVNKVRDLQSFVMALEKELKQTNDVVLKTDISIILGKIQGKRV